MPVTERLVAITECLGSHHPFRAIVKQSSKDFIVKEVMQNGQIAEVTRLPKFRQKRRARDEPGTTDDSPQANKPVANTLPTDEQFAKLDELVPEPDDDSASNLIRDMLQAAPHDSPVILPACDSKALRTEIHAWVRNHLPRYISDTLETDEGQAIRVRPESAVRPSKRRRSDRYRELPVGAPGASPTTAMGDGVDLADIPRGVPVQFILWKRDRDTNDALNLLAKFLHVHPSAFSYAGTKDKRAVTTQLVQVKNVNENSFVHVNRKLGKHPIPNILVSDVAIGNKKGLRLGDLLGNRFTLVLRDLDIASSRDEENIQLAWESLRTYGFVNYFGLQRFGSGMSPTHETGFAVLRGDFEDVCRRLLLPLRFGENGNEDVRPERLMMVNALDDFAAKKINANDLLGKLPARMLVERTIAKQFANDEERGVAKYDYRAAFSKLPRNLRRMYGHAVQSYLFNVMASERVRYHRPNDISRMHAIEGDLILVKETDENEMSYLSEVRSVTKEEEETKCVSIHRVIIPVVGSEVDVPKNKCGELVAKLLSDEKVCLKTPLSVELGMKGTYRKLLARPTDVDDLKFVFYSHKDEPLVSLFNVKDLCLNEGDKAENKNHQHEGHTEGKPANVEVAGGESKDGATASCVEENQKENGQSCGMEVGTEAKPETEIENGTKLKVEANAICPENNKATSNETMKEDKQNVGDNLESTFSDKKEEANEPSNPEEMVHDAKAEAVISGTADLESDSKADSQGVKMASGSMHSDNNNSEVSQRVLATDKQDDVKIEAKEKKRRALVISFTLGCAEYATMMVRELTKSDSSAANQRALQEVANVKK